MQFLYLSHFNESLINLTAKYLPFYVYCLVRTIYIDKIASYSDQRKTTIIIIALIDVSEPFSHILRKGRPQRRLS